MFDGGLGAARLDAVGVVLISDKVAWNCTEDGMPGHRDRGAGNMGTFAKLYRAPANGRVKWYTLWNNRRASIPTGRLRNVHQPGRKARHGTRE